MDIDPQDNIEKYRARIKNPMTAIRAFCVECMGGYHFEVKNCTAKKCPLLPFRMGKNPFHKRIDQKDEKAS